MTEHPNILVILTDQQTAGAMSCTGNRQLATPAMDSLAARGVRFDRAYCAQPLCTPSRSSMMTGKYPHQLGINGNVKITPDFADTCPGLGNYAKMAGYHACYAGKWHVPTGSMQEGDPHGFQVLSPKGDAVSTQACVDYLSRKPDKPFLMVCSYSNPHDICQWARGQKLPEGPIDESHVNADLPPNFPIPPYEAEMVSVIRQRFSSSHPTGGYSDEDWRRYLNAYYRICEKVDGEIGQLLQALSNTGLENNTLVVFTSDHGDGAAAHHWNQKNVLYEESSRVPFIIAGPEIAQARTEATFPISNGIDLLPTLCEVMGITPTGPLPGESLLPYLKGGIIPTRQYVGVETSWHPGFKEAEGRALCGHRFKYTVYSYGRNREQLHDLHSDPGEMVNLAPNPKHRERLLIHRRLLANWCRAHQDFSFLKALPDPFVASHER